jgi:NADPH:quinone reductase-like Zn-dependent oxidoreductase
VTNVIIFLKLTAAPASEYGSPDVLKFQDVTKPVPTGTEILLAVHAVATNAAD